MSEFKGTKGKWYWEEGFDTEMGSIKSTHGEKVCDFGNEERYYPTEGTEPNKYDRLLMVKAPEMLEILNDIDGLLDNGVIVTNDWIHERVKRLIKQATTI